MHFGRFLRDGKHIITIYGGVGAGRHREESKKKKKRMSPYKPGRVRKKSNTASKRNSPSHFPFIAHQTKTITALQRSRAAFGSYALQLNVPNRKFPQNRFASLRCDSRQLNLLSTGVCVCVCVSMVPLHFASFISALQRSFRGEGRR